MRDACVNLLSIWLRSVDYDTVEVRGKGSPASWSSFLTLTHRWLVQLLESIDVIGNEQLATKALSSLFSAIKEALEHAVGELCLWCVGVGVWVNVRARARARHRS